MKYTQTINGDTFRATLVSMYIRKTSIKSKKDGSQYYSYRLVESKRTEKGVRQYTLLILGADFTFPKEQWYEVANRIESILNKQSLFHIYSNIEQICQSCAARIIVSRQDVEHSESDDYREVDLALEQHVYERERSLFGLRETISHYPV